MLSNLDIVTFNLCISRVTYILALISILSVNECHSFSTTSDKSNTNTLLNLLHIAGSAVHSASSYAKNEMRLLEEKPMDCAEIFEQNNESVSGVYKIWPRNRISNGFIRVFCDMVEDGGGWTIIQRRGDFDSGKDYFYRDWASYKAGFGDLSKDFWIGNDNLFMLTNERDNIVKFVLSDWESNKTYAIYEEFYIEDEAHNYTMHVSGYRGNAGDGFSFTNGQSFTTKDRDNDLYSKNCAVVFKGAWWYAACHSSNLNGQYLKGDHESYADGVNWAAFRGQKYSLKDTWIKMRPKFFDKNTIDNITPQ